MSPTDFIAWLDSADRRPLVMGVLNVTPDSFSDGGQFIDSHRAIARAREMIQQGADIIDIGGESTRPGSQRVDPDEQIKRVEPVIRELAKIGIAISIDTTRAKVAKSALDAGASIINDISAGIDDPAIFQLAAARKCPFILMHMQGQPATMQASPTYSDVISEVKEHLLARATALQSAGLPKNRIILDPGIGFGKTAEHSLTLLNSIDQLVATGYPILSGTSRKSFIAKTLNLPTAGDRTFGTAASVAWSIANGAAIVRVHDVEAMKQVVQMTHAIAKTGKTNAR